MQTDPFFSDLQKQIEHQLEKLFPVSEQPFSQAARYCLLGGGKRFRPLLMLAAVASYKTPLETALIPACALEMIHTYSLIHDDLPCIDDDDMRRGKPSLHKIVPEWHALLTGDYLLTYAFDLLSHAPDITDAQKIALIQLFSKCAGAEGLLGGQMIDLLSEDQAISWPLLEEMHVKKTANLMILALVSGGILANAPTSDLDLLKRIGHKIGLIYQLLDDLADAVEEEGSDMKKKKATALSVLGFEKTHKHIHILYHAALALLEHLSTPAPHLKTLLTHLTEK